MSSTKENNRIILPQANDMPAADSSFVQWLIFFLRPYFGTLMPFLVLRISRYIVLYLLPLAIGLTIKAFESGWAFENKDTMMLAAGIYMVFYCITLVSIGLFSKESAAQDRIIRGMTMFSIRHMNSLPLDWHEAEGSGGKLQRIMTARTSLKGLIDIYKWFLLPFVGSMLAIIVSVAIIDAPLWFILLYLGFSASFCGAAIYAAKPLPGLHKQHNALMERLLSGVYEFVSAVRTVKAFDMGGYIERKAKIYEHEGHDAWQNVLKTIFRKWIALNTVASFWMCTFFILCVAGVYGGWLSIGAFATVFYLAYNLWSALENLVYIQDQFIEGRAGFMRLTETLTVRPTQLDKIPAIALPKDWQQLQLNKIDFSYRDAKTHALHNITLDIKRGEKVALVGPSGAGKSTLARLLMKQMWPENGAITLDQIDLCHIPGAEWLAHIGFVPQDVELFNMSIRDNILLDRADSADEELYQTALKQSALAEFIDSLPDKDETMIGERGIKLSGGQRQRLGIARALVRQAELIIFDEATSALDSLSERAIQEAIEQSFTGKTLVVIAHRLSTVRHVDKIFVMVDGKLAEQGSFDDLINQNGTFAKMWALQSEGFDNDGKEIAQKN